MGRDQSSSHDQTMTHISSIVLLQERFRQLQRVKEMREGKEMLRLFSESDHCTSPANIQPSNLFFQSELLCRVPPKVAAPVVPPSSHLTCLSLWPDTHVSDNTKRSHCLNNMSWISNNSTAQFYDVDDHDNESDVDTSLHL